jgi:hypothetical protein
MAPRLIDHFAPGLFGRYRGHSVVHDNGKVDHYESDGSLVPFERYVGSSVIKETSGGGGGLDLDFTLPWFFLIPLVMLIAIPLLLICPGLWLVWRAFRKKGDNQEHKGAGWVTLAVFMIMIGGGLAINMSVLLLPVFPKSLFRPKRPDSYLRLVCQLPGHYPSSLEDSTFFAKRTRRP